MTQERADAARPTAHALVQAVANQDPTAVAAALRNADHNALCVVLADMIANPSDSIWLGALLRDLRDPDLTRRQVAARYGINEHVLRRFCDDNEIAADVDVVTELPGRWVTHRGVARWVSEAEHVA